MFHLKMFNQHNREAHPVCCLLTGELAISSVSTELGQHRGHPQTLTWTVRTACETLHFAMKGQWRSEQPWTESEAITLDCLLPLVLTIQPALPPSNFCSYHSNKIHFSWISLTLYFQVQRSSVCLLLKTEGKMWSSTVRIPLLSLTALPSRLSTPGSVCLSFVPRKSEDWNYVVIGSYRKTPTHTKS